MRKMGTMFCREYVKGMIVCQEDWNRVTLTIYNYNSKYRFTSYKSGHPSLSLS